MNLGIVVLTLSSLVPAHAQDRVESLRAADSAFADALIRHDRAAFVAFFAPDAESHLPVEKHGPEDIANSWLPFLVDPGTTMLLTNTGATRQPSGDVGTSSGTMAIKGRTDRGVQTLPLGSYSITWRIIDGHWKISALRGSFERKNETTDRGGVGGFRFGMTRQEVAEVADCQAYSHVAVTGGLECPHYKFEGREINISFIFNANSLHRIQLWIYEGDSESEAREGVNRVIEYLARRAGPATITGLPGTEVTAEAVMQLLNSRPVRLGTINHVVLATGQSAPEKWYSKIGRHQFGYGVMLFAELSSGQQ